MPKNCCNESLALVSVYDAPESGYAYNLFVCQSCGTIIKEDVWSNSGTLTVKTNGEVVHERS